MRYYEIERECIDMFREEYYFLSNYYPAVVKFDGVTYLNSEAAYQAQKCSERSKRLRFTNKSANEAKSLGGTVDLREDWDKVKLPLMQEIVHEKFTQHSYLAEWLLKTGDKELKEGNYWGDLFWDVDHKTGEGENHLGRILMDLRDYFRNNGLPEESEPFLMTYGPFDRMSVVFGDITQSDCMCIVNPADNSLLGGGGVDGIIHMAAGRGLMEEWKTLKGCETGESKITKGYDLKARYIIHTVGPHYPEEGHEELLRSAYRNTMELAKENRITSIAFPAISTGKFSYPVQEATEIAVDTVRKWMLDNPDYPINVVFASVEKRIYECFCNQISNPVQQ